MRGIDVFCERCGARQPIERPERAPSGASLARRFASAVSRTADGVPGPEPEMFLRLCLDCRGYSCPACWNEDEGRCQTCAPMLVVEAPAAPAPPAESPAMPEIATLAVEPNFETAESPAMPEIATLAVEPNFETAESPVPTLFAAPEEPEPVVLFEPVAIDMVAPPPPAVVAPPPPVAPPPLAVVQPPRPVAPPQPIVPPPPPAAPPSPPVLPDPLVPAPVVQPRPRPAITFDVPEPIVPVPAILAQATPAPPVFAIAAPAAARDFVPVPPSPSAANVPAGVRPCRSCQLALSAKAHFCRRCGVAQER